MYNKTCTLGYRGHEAHHPFTGFWVRLVRLTIAGQRMRVGGVGGLTLAGGPASLLGHLRSV